MQSASTWMAQRALSADVVLSSITTCSKRISSEGPDPEVKAVCLSGHLFEVMKATYHHLVLLSALLRQRNTYTWCWPWRPSRVRTLKLGAPPLRGLDGHLSSTWYCSALCFGRETRTHGVGRGDPREFELSSWARHLFKDLMATYHPPGIPDEVACKPSHTSGPSDSFGGNMMSTSPAVCS